MDAWLRSTAENLFDPDILTYRDKVQFFCSRDGQPIVFLPIQNVLMLESLAIAPGATGLQVAKSIEVLMKHIVCKALELAYNELYFIIRDKDVAAYAERHGFENLLTDKEKGISLFRLKVGRICQSTSQG